MQIDKISNIALVVNLLEVNGIDQMYAEIQMINKTKNGIQIQIKYFNTL